MTLIISIDGADFEPYRKVYTRNPLINPPGSANPVHPIKSNTDQPDDFEELLSQEVKKGLKSYKEVAKEPDKAPRKAVYAKDLMTSPVITLNEDEDIEAAKALFAEHEIRHLPIINSKDIIVGVISDRDIALNKDEKLVKEIMIKDIVAGELDTRLQEIARAMVAHKIHSIPILNEIRQVVGIVTSTDLLESVFKNPNVDLFC